MIQSEHGWGVSVSVKALMKQCKLGLHAFGGIEYFYHLITWIEINER